MRFYSCNLVYPYRLTGDALAEYQRDINDRVASLRYTDVAKLLVEPPENPAPAEQAEILKSYVMAWYEDETSRLMYLAAEHLRENAPPAFIVWHEYGMPGAGIYYYVAVPDGEPTTQLAAAVCRPDGPIIRIEWYERPHDYKTIRDKTVAEEYEQEVIRRLSGA